MNRAPASDMPELMDSTVYSHGAVIMGVMGEGANVGGVRDEEGEGEWREEEGEWREEEEEGVVEFCSISDDVALVTRRRRRLSHRRNMFEEDALTKLLIINNLFLSCPL